MLEETEKAGEIQSVERPSSQAEKNGAATIGQIQHIDRKEKFVCGHFGRLLALVRYHFSSPLSSGQWTSGLK
jgi:hypothetical protein